MVAVPGRAPKAAAQKRNRVQSTVEWTEVPDVPFAGVVPELPESRTIVTRDGQVSVELQALTRQWWETISVMPHCVLWSASDWMFALSTALVADAAFCGIAAAQTELRNREKVLGTTSEFRRGLRIRYVPVKSAPAGESPAEVTDIADYRDL